MKTTLMELGMILVAVMLLIPFLATFGLLLGEGGGLREIILHHISNIC